MKKNLFSLAAFLLLLLAVYAIGAKVQATTNGSASQSHRPLQIARQGVFSSGGRVTVPVPGEYDATKNWLDMSRKGTTAHVDHANTFYQIPVGGSGIPVVFLHGYGQSRTGWQTTPDGREGWSDIFLGKGYSVFLVDQPRRGAAGATEKMTADAIDADGNSYKLGDQAWYTHFRIGRVTPGRYEGSQFPAGDAAQNQFFCQMTPNTGGYDEKLFGEALSAVLEDVKKITGRKAVYVTHSQGGRVGWRTDAENIAAIVAVEPGGAPQVGSAEYKKFLAAKVPMLFLFGDYIENGPKDIQSTAFWQAVLKQCRDFAAQYNKDGGDAKVIYLPDMGIHGNSHFMFEEMNNGQIADLVADWLKSHQLGGATKEDMPFTNFGNTLPREAFHGEAYISNIIAKDSVFNFPTTNVITFAPGAHSNWHRHGGMDILVTGGVGIYQQEGRAAQVLRKGDVLHIPTGTRHWHGAAPGNWFQQIVIYDKDWKPTTHYADVDNTVTDEAYNHLAMEEYPHQNARTDISMFAPGDSLLQLPTFTGKVLLSNTLEANNASGAPGIHNVVFEPGVYNAWHEHPGGQILLVTDGVIYHQLKGKPVEVLHPGDVALCPPNVLHWHGAAPGSRAAHLAVGTNPGRPAVKWTKKFVSKKAYDKIKKRPA